MEDLLTKRGFPIHMKLMDETQTDECAGLLRPEFASGNTLIVKHHRPSLLSRQCSPRVQPSLDSPQWVSVNVIERGSTLEQGLWRTILCARWLERSSCPYARRR
ncbi:hypothetical protein M408DRAFT_100321 [Serendipita vermifera MAFF 305830]|uniref:Uncharacterized protein n=1 Tax=Serendipita vermifera MAFF 305830 TaxID=933852 RepID=A0A0C3BD31_SERVB|nr:hypothetical protein M408DRAFT_100321 [Serendipita vermifera MAFF 305830]